MKTRFKHYVQRRVTALSGKRHAIVNSGAHPPFRGYESEEVNPPLVASLLTPHEAELIAHVRSNSGAK